MKSHLDNVNSPVPWNKGRLVGQKAPLKLREIWAIRIRLQLADKSARPGAVQPCHRQQAARLRLGRSAGLRHCSGQDHPAARHGHAAQDPSTGAVRDHRADQTVSRILDREGHLCSDQYLVPKQGDQVAAFVHPPVRPSRDLLGRVNWSGCGSLWYAHHAANKGNIDLPTDQEPARRTASSRT